ncbi:MAG TPA: 16S rRNA (guanine(527)-N(7))-methyltransferase RsmG [Arcobacter sp.]|jgi:16S rRNA (guanine527-N7)-methyltransferase|nr:16S rRNA (guanine(527)-N(7))-methyltransferase RsmG [Arcobacter sp.]
MKKEFENLGLEFDELFYDRCNKFITILQDWGATHNFTSPKALANNEIEGNIIDSVYPLKFLNNFDSFADIGTGAGYPGMILAIARPDVKCALIEPKAKRVAFLNFVKNILRLENVEVLHKRAQDVAPNGYDLITSRAVTNTSLLLSITNNLKHNDTEFLFYKGSLCEQELEDVKVNNYEIHQVGEYRNYLYIKRKGLF